MNDIELKELWVSQNQKLNKVLNFQKAILNEHQLNTAFRSLQKTRPVKYLGIILGVPWIFVLWFITTSAWQTQSYILMGSMAVIASLTTALLVNYIYQLILISQVEYSTSILETQRTVASLKSSTLSGLRVAVLQLPFWTTWYFTIDGFESGGLVYIAVNMTLTGLFVILAIWLFLNIKMENVNKKWLKWLLSDAEWQSLIKASSILEEIEQWEDK